jgi:glycosyltransferase involved in cell wall biosynthesis
MKNITLLFPDFGEEHFGKEVFLTPYYIGKTNRMNVSIVFPKGAKNEIISSEVRGIRLIPLTVPKRTYIRDTLYLSVYLLKNIRKIDVLMLVHFMHQAAIIGSIYKLLKPQGLLYVKGDGIGMCTEGVEERVTGSRKIKDKIVCRLFGFFFKKADLLTVETQRDYNRILEHKMFGVDLRNKVKLMYNGFDEDLLSAYKLKLSSFEEKENIILTVGRVGSFQKNTEMLLNALPNLKMRDWKVVLIGPIENNERDFQREIDKFFSKNAELKEHVAFTNAIYDKKIVWEWFNKAKVFLMTSRYEGFANVYAEAARFNDYIVSTDVGGAREWIETTNYGEIIAGEDSEGLAEKLQMIMDDNHYLAFKYRGKSEKIDFSWEKQIKNAIVFDKLKS